jgi:hypothetical protein
LLWAGAGLAVGLVSHCFAATASPQTAQPAAQGAAARRIGAIKAISGNTVTLTPDSGAEVSIVVQESTRLVRIAPGETNLKNATPVTLPELQVGDRILAGGKASDDGKSMTASSIVVMKRADVEARQQHDRDDWQKRGVAGVVKAVDAATATVTISVSGMSASKNVAVHTTKDTVVRRYAPDSVKFDDARTSTLSQIQAGDQLRALGSRSADGNDVVAEEIVSGAFRNIAGTISSIDAGAATMNVQDLLTKKNVLVKITSESQLRKLPPQVAQRIAMRLKGAAAGAIPGAAGATGAGAASPGGSGGGQGSQSASAAPSSGTGAGGGMGSGRSGAAPDFQQMLSHMPAATLADLQKGDAVIMVATQGTSAGVTAITLLAGVEPILQAAPSAASALMLSPWSLSAPAGDAGTP